MEAARPRPPSLSATCAPTGASLSARSREHGSILCHKSLGVVVLGKQSSGRHCPGTGAAPERGSVWRLAELSALFEALRSGQGWVWTSHAGLVSGSPRRTVFVYRAEIPVASQPRAGHLLDMEWCGLVTLTVLPPWASMTCSSPLSLPQLGLRNRRCSAQEAPKRVQGSSECAL